VNKVISPKARDVSHPHKTAGKVIALHLIFNALESAG
jgi:hypothetical protein